MNKNSQEEWLFHLYSQAPVAIGIYLGEKHTIEFANPRMLEIWGRSFDQVQNKPLFTALPEVSNQGFEEILMEVYRSGNTFTGNELPATLTRNGKLDLAYVNIVYEPLRNEDNKIYGIIQTATEVTDLVVARKKAERNEEILNLALEAGKMSTWYIDYIHNFSTLTGGYKNLIGTQIPEKVNLDKNVRDFFNQVIAEDREMAIENYRLALENGLLDYEVRMKWPDGTIHWIHIKGETSYNLKGKPINMTGIAMDITEKKHSEIQHSKLIAEQAARKEAERQNEGLKELFMEAPAMICTLVGPEHIFDLVNPMYQQLLPGKVLVGRKLTEAVPELIGQSVMQILDDVYKTGKTFIGKELKIFLDRYDRGVLEPEYFNFVYQPRRDYKGEIIGILVFAYTITEQIHSRQELERKDESLRMALEAGEMGVWTYNISENQFIRSAQHDQIFGYKKQLKEWSLETYAEHIAPENRDKFRIKLNTARKTGNLYIEAKINRADGETRYIALKGQVFFKDKTPIRMAGVVMDITYRRKTEQLLHQLTKDLAQKNDDLTEANDTINLRLNELSDTNTELTKINEDLDNFIYTASHDLKAPIANLEGLLITIGEVMRKGELDKNKEYLKKILNFMNISVERFKNTIAELTEIAQVQKEISDYKTIDPDKIIEEVKLDLLPIIEDIDAEVIFQLEDCSPFVFSPKNFKSIVYNLLSNALKYHSDERKPMIKFSCGQSDGYQHITVQDNGLGIKESGKDKIFQMFKRLHSHVEGSGVGLYLVKRIVDNAGGKLEFESEVNKGSTFHVYLPLILAENFKSSTV